MTIRHKVYITNKKKLRKAYENTVALAWELSSDQPPQLNAWSREKLGKCVNSLAARVRFRSRFSRGSSHLHEKTGNTGGKIKWLAQFGLESLRKHGLWLEEMQFFHFF